MDVYKIRYVIDGVETKSNKYTDYTKAMNEAKKWIVDKAVNEMEFKSYLSAIRMGDYVKYREAVSDYFQRFIADGTFSPEIAPWEFPENYIEKQEKEDFDEENTDGEKEDFEDYSRPESVDPEDVIHEFKDFDVWREDDIEICEFYAENGAIAFHFEFNFLDRFYDFDYYDESAYLFLKDSEHEFKVEVILKELDWLVDEKSHSADILLVYKCLSDVPKTRKELRDEIYERADVDISEVTIGKQIAALCLIGLPVGRKGMNYIQRQENFKQKTPHEEGFYFEIFPPQMPTGRVIDPSNPKIGNKVLPLLVLFALQNFPKKPTQQEIIDYVKVTYGVEMRRAVVGRHQKLLKNLGYGATYKGEI